MREERETSHVNPSTQYERLTLLRRSQSFDPEVSHSALSLHFQSEPIVRIRTKGRRTFFLRRQLFEEDEHQVVYRVFVDERSAKAAENDVAFCRLTKPEDGIATIVNAEVKEAFRKKGIATAVYDCIARDLERAGALLWPASPAKMADAEFKMWWRCSPALVFYYPHRERLGFAPRQEFEDLLNEGGATKLPITAPSQSAETSRMQNRFARARRWFFRTGD